MDEECPTPPADLVVKKLKQPEAAEKPIVES